MYKNLLKISALALGMFAFGMIYTNAQSTTGGTVTLSINTGASECTFGSFNLGTHDMAFNESLTVSGLSNTGTWECKDLKGGVRGWTYTIQAADLSNGNGGTIPATAVSLKHDAAVVTGDDACAGGSATSYTGINSAYALIERANSGNGSLCSVGLPNVTAQVEIPANQAPGSYVGTLTLTSNEGFTIQGS